MNASSSSSANGQDSIPLRQDARTIGLIGLAHGSSHFFHLLLPPLFPWLIADFGYSYSELSVLLSVFFIVSGVGQALAGFVVDRLGARPILFASLTSFIVAGVIASSAQGYATATGSWRIACLCGSALAAVVLLIMVLNRDALDDRKPVAQPAAAAKPAAAGHAPPEHAMAFLRLPSVWLCFSFFFWSTCALSAIQSFASPALQAMYGLPLSLTALVATGYMLCGATGMLLGGFLVGRVQRLEKLIAISLLASALLLALVGTGLLSGYVAMAVAAVAGLGTGIAGPSRDMLIKQAAPAGATGRVYGTVYSGLDLGFCLAAPVFGSMLDAQMHGSVFLGSATALALSVVSAAFVGQKVAAAKFARA